MNTAGPSQPSRKSQISALRIYPDAIDKYFDLIIVIMPFTGYCHYSVFLEPIQPVGYLYPLAGFFLT
jgi:hypothetical protein